MWIYDYKLPNSLQKKGKLLNFKNHSFISFNPTQVISNSVSFIFLRTFGLIDVTNHYLKPIRYSFSSGNAEDSLSWRKALFFPSECLVSMTKSTGTSPFSLAWYAKTRAFFSSHEVEVNPVNWNTFLEFRQSQQPYMAFSGNPRPRQRVMFFSFVSNSQPFFNLCFDF